MPDLGRTCHHEAGHAIAYWALTGIVPDEIQINANGSGRMTHRQYPVLGPECEAIVSAAGGAAELRYEFDDSPNWEFIKRYVHVMLLVADSDDVDGTGTDLSFLLKVRRERHVIKRTTTLIDEHWHRVERLAGALFTMTRKPDFQTAVLAKPDIGLILTAETGWS